MAKHEDQLDQALHAYLSGEVDRDPSIEPYSEILEGLDVLREVPERAADQHSIGRQTFLEQAKSLPRPVSTKSDSRLKGWKKILRRERFSMTSIMGFVLAIVLTFGGLGTVGVAAQDSLPTEPLYAIKQLTEELRFGLTIDHQEKVNLLMNFVAERVREMSGLIENEETIPRQTALRLENHLQLALQAAAQLESSEMIRTLTQLHQRTQAHLQTMERLQQQNPFEESLQLATRAMVQAQRAAEDGLEDPATFRNRQGTNRPQDAPEQPEIPPPGGEGTGNGEGSDQRNGSGGQGQGMPGNVGNGQDQGVGDGSSGSDGSGDGSGAGSQGESDGSDSAQGDGSGDGSGSGSNGQGDGSGTNGESGRGK